MATALACSTAARLTAAVPQRSLQPRRLAVVGQRRAMSVQAAGGWRWLRWRSGEEGAAAARRRCSTGAPHSTAPLALRPPQPARW